MSAIALSVTPPRPPAAGPPGDSVSRPAKIALSRAARLLAQVAPLLLLVGVLLHPPSGWPARRSPHAVEAAFMLALNAAACWVPAISISGAREVLRRPLLGKTRLMMAIGAADVTAGALLLAVGEFRVLPPDALLTAALTIAAGGVIIASEGVISLTRVGKVEHSPFKVETLVGWRQVVGVALTFPLAALAAASLTHTLEISPDPRWWATLAGALPGPALVLAWCGRARRRLALMRGEEGKGLCAAALLYLFSAALLSLAFLLTPRVVWLGAALGVASAGGIAFDRAITCWSLNSLFQRATISAGPARGGVLLLEAEPPAYTGRLMAAIEDILSESTGPVLVLTRRGSKLADLLRRTGSAVMAYLTAAPISHPRALDEGGREREVGASVSQLSALVSGVMREAGTPITLIVDSFNDLVGSLGVRDAYSLLRVLSDLVLGEGGRVIVISFPSAMGPREAAVARTLATDVLLL